MRRVWCSRSALAFLVAIAVLSNAAEAQWWANGGAYRALDWRLEFGSSAAAAAWSISPENPSLWDAPPLHVAGIAGGALVLPVPLSATSPRLAWLNLSAPHETAAAQGVPMRDAASWPSGPLAAVSPRIAAGSGFVAAQWANVSTVFPVSIVGGTFRPGMLLTGTACDDVSPVAAGPSTIVVTTCHTGSTSTTTTTTLRGFDTATGAERWALPALDRPTSRRAIVGPCSNQAAGTSCVLVTNRSGTLAVALLDAETGALSPVAMAINPSPECVALTSSTPLAVVPSPRDGNVVIFSAAAAALVDRASGSALWCRNYRVNATAPVPPVVATIANNGADLFIATNDGFPSRVATVTTLSVAHGTPIGASKTYPGQLSAFPGSAEYPLTLAVSATDGIAVISAPGADTVAAISLASMKLRWVHTNYTLGWSVTLSAPSLATGVVPLASFSGIVHFVNVTTGVVTAKATAGNYGARYFAPVPVPSPAAAAHGKGEKWLLPTTTCAGVVSIDDADPPLAFDMPYISSDFDLPSSDQVVSTPRHTYFPMAPSAGSNVSVIVVVSRAAGTPRAVLPIVTNGAAGVVAANGTRVVFGTASEIVAIDDACIAELPAGVPPAPESVCVAWRTPAPGLFQVVGDRPPAAMTTATGVFAIQYRPSTEGSDHIGSFDFLSLAAADGAVRANATSICDANWLGYYNPPGVGLWAVWSARLSAYVAVVANGVETLEQFDGMYVTAIRMNADSGSASVLWRRAYPFVQYWGAVAAVETRLVMAGVTPLTDDPNASSQQGVFVFDVDAESSVPVQRLPCSVSDLRLNNGHLYATARLNDGNKSGLWRLDLDEPSKTARVALSDPSEPSYNAIVGFAGPAAVLTNTYNEALFGVDTATGAQRWTIAASALGGLMGVKMFGQALTATIQPANDARLWYASYVLDPLRGDQLQVVPTAAVNSATTYDEATGAAAVIANLPTGVVMPSTLAVRAPAPPAGWAPTDVFTPADATQRVTELAYLPPPPTTTAAPTSTGAGPSPSPPGTTPSPWAPPSPPTTTTTTTPAPPTGPPGPSSTPAPWQPPTTTPAPTPYHRPTGSSGGGGDSTQKIIIGVAATCAALVCIGCVVWWRAKRRAAAVARERFAAGSTYQPLGYDATGGDVNNATTGVVVGGNYAPHSNSDESMQV